MLRLMCRIATLACCAACSHTGAARAQLLELHEMQRRAHVEENAAGLVALFDEPFFELRDGVLQQPTREASLARLQRYFDAVEFLAWDDLSPPRIEIARDGSMATMAVQKLVRVRTQDADGAARIERTLFAWMASCVHRDLGWRIASVASTRRPQDAAASLAALRHALGGETLIARLREADAGFACRGPAGDYRLELQLPREGSWRMRWIFPQRPEQVFDVEGHAGWAVDVGGARAPLSDAEVAMLRSHAFPWLALDPAAFFFSIAHAGTRLDSGRTLERLSMTDSAGQPAAAEIDLSTDLLLSLELSDTRSDPPAQVTLRFESWRRVAGLLLPERIVAIDARGTWTMDLDFVRVDFGPG